jgi:hypothetical protein
MHGVVLQIRVFWTADPMFHVKHSCVRGLPSQAGGAMFHVKPFSPAPLMQPSARDVSRETFLRKAPQYILFTESASGGWTGISGGSGTHWNWPLMAAAHFLARS